MPEKPSYDGRGLVNLAAEIELRLTGESAWTGLSERSVVPDADTYVLVLFDGLGVAQLDHPAARRLAADHAATLEAPFPTTTSVSMATVATGLPPSRHGLVGHLVWLEEHDRVVNTLKWVDLTGAPVDHDYATFLPRPNLWERLRAAGIEPVTVQFDGFDGTPFSRLVYRGARFERAWDLDDMAEATVMLASRPRRLVFTYFPSVDVAGHVTGLGTTEFSEAMAQAASLWDRIASSLPPGAVLLGTADHGLAEFPPDRKLILEKTAYPGLRYAGDSRGVQLWGDPAEMEALADRTGGVLADPAGLIGPDPTGTALARLGGKVLLPPDDVAVIPPGFDKRLACYHGGLSLAEVEIPLLIG
ncbi:MAG: alkaline phosphatase family protein [Actinomycetes bacterium]